MSLDDLDYSLNIELSFTNETEAKLIHLSVYPDVLYDMKDLSIDLTLDKVSIHCCISSSSYAKFRGAITTLLRLIYVSSKILDVVSNDEL